MIPKIFELELYINFPHESINIPTTIQLADSNSSVSRSVDMLVVNSQHRVPTLRLCGEVITTHIGSMIDSDVTFCRFTYNTNSKNDYLKQKLNFKRKFCIIIYSAANSKLVRHIFKCSLNILHGSNLLNKWQKICLRKHVKLLRQLADPDHNLPSEKKIITQKG